MFEDRPKIHVTLTRKVSDGNWGSAEVSMSVSHIPFDAPPEEVDNYINQAGFVVEKMKAQLRQKVAEIRKEGDAPAERGLGFVEPQPKFAGRT